MKMFSRSSDRGAFRPRLVLLMAMALGLCTPVFAESPRIVLLYASKWEELFLLPAAGIPQRAELSLPNGAPFAADPLLLRTVDGKVAAARMTMERLVAYWGAAAQKGYAGIGIDEFAAANRHLTAKLVMALALTRWRYPRLYIAVWQAGRLTEELADAYRKYASLVVLEGYASDEQTLAKLTADNLAVARATGILHKTVVGLGINNLDPTVSRTWSPWANTPAQIEAQMKWVNRTVPISPGIALFAVNASPSLQSSAFSLAVKVFAREHRR